MNEQQRLWIAQARSDYAVFITLRESGSHPCHLLHYLQMSTEKLSKAYVWRSGKVPKKSHIGFSVFLRSLRHLPSDQDREVVASSLGFKSFREFSEWAKDAAPIANGVERLAPALAGDGPNPEYPWPPGDPRWTPVEHEFDVWSELTNKPRGRQFLQVLGRAIERFSSFA
ncbi:MAG: hypothetical protein ACRCT8_12645 [Lacipirellulaceae bacterium]